MCVIAVVLAGCADFAERRNTILSKYLSADVNSDGAVREAIMNGKVIEGMTTEQVFIASAVAAA